MLKLKKKKKIQKQVRNLKGMIHNDSNSALNLFLIKSVNYELAKDYVPKYKAYICC